VCRRYSALSLYRVQLYHKKSTYENSTIEWLGCLTVAARRQPFTGIDPYTDCGEAAKKVCEVLTSVWSFSWRNHKFNFIIITQVMPKPLFYFFLVAWSGFGVGLSFLFGSSKLLSMLLMRWLNVTKNMIKRSSGSFSGGVGLIRRKLRTSSEIH
jgi:hypothetical protein